MNDLQHIEEALRRVVIRRRWSHAFAGLAWGLLIGAACAFLIYGLYKLLPIPAGLVTAAFMVAGVAGVVGFVAGLMRRVSLLETARWVDVQLGLKERLGTALELGTHPGSEEWQQLVLHDASMQLQRIEPRALVPFQFPRAARGALAGIVLCACLGFVPAYRSQAWQQKKQDEVRVRDTGKKLAGLTRQTLLQKPPVLVPTQKAMTEVAELGDRMANVKLTRSEAMRDLSNLADKLVQQNKPLNDSPALKKMEKAARENSGAASSPEEMQKQLAALQDKLGQGAATADKLDQLQKNLEKLQQSAAAMNDKDAKPSAAQRERMAQELSSLAKQAEEMGVPLSSLDEAIQAMKNGQTDLVLRDLEAAMNDLEKLRDLAKSMQQLQQQMAKLGKDLGEQLKNGQVRAAQATLQKMIDQLASAKLTPEQEKKILEEVAKAADPAGEYGKVKDHLEMAAQQMRTGRKAQAAQSLAAAKKDLEELLQQMADAQAMEAMLAAMSRAEAALAMNKSWDDAQPGNCPACGGYGCDQCSGRKGRWGHGGKPGAGVGTWADEQEGWSAFNKTDGMPDNSQIKRPDLDARGHSDRPDDLSPALMPTKVRGQMAPGGSMPSITLKGVSIKGTSNVKYEEAAAAAQAEAESALSQDKIPRAYQGAVRDYFDDLKK